jgi:hypothetical protein
VDVADAGPRGDLHREVDHVLCVETPGEPDDDRGVEGFSFSQTVQTVLPLLVLAVREPGRLVVRDRLDISEG